MAGQITDNIRPWVPALREFVDAVNEDPRDPEFVAECMRITDPRTLAVLAAGWVGELLNERDAMAERVFVAETVAEELSARYVDMRERRDYLRNLKGLSSRGNRN